MELKLRVVQGKQRDKYLIFPEGEFVFGRGPECHVRPNSDWISRQHCLLRVGRAGISVRDLGSTNGTLVNGVRVVDEHGLIDGDQLQLGPVVLQVVVEQPDSNSPINPMLKETGITLYDTVETFILPAPDKLVEKRS